MTTSLFAFDLLHASLFYSSNSSLMFVMINNMPNSGWLRLRENLCLLLWKRLKKVKQLKLLLEMGSVRFLYYYVEAFGNFFNFIIWWLFANRANAFWASLIVDGTLDCFCGQDLC